MAHLHHSAKQTQANEKFREKKNLIECPIETVNQLIYLFLQPQQYYGRLDIQQNKY